MNIQKQISFLFFLVFIFIPSTTQALTKELKIPFTPQIPPGESGAPWDNACEETALVMVNAYYNKETFQKDTAKEKIKEMLSLKETNFSQSLDETLPTLQKLTSYIQNKKWSSTLVKSPTIEQIKKEINNAHPVIVAFNAQNVTNPYFKNVKYHVAVITGYDDTREEFILNEPGTKNGNRFRYSFEELLKANSSYTISDTGETRENEFLFTSPLSKCSLPIRTVVSNTKKNYYITPDCKKRLLTAANLSEYIMEGEKIPQVSTQKIQALATEKTNLVQHGPQYEIKPGSIVKTSSDTTLYFISTEKHAFNSMEEFFRFGFKKEWIETVDEATLNTFNQGVDISSSTPYITGTLIVLPEDKKQIYQLEYKTVDSSLIIVLRPIKDEKFFNQVNYRKEKIINLPPLFSYEIGPSVNYKFEKSLSKDNNTIETAKDVLELQKRLVKYDFLTEDSVSGIFEDTTEEAVKKFQIFHGLDPLGVLGPKTRQILNSID